LDTTFFVAENANNIFNIFDILDKSLPLLV